MYIWLQLLKPFATLPLRDEGVHLGALASTRDLYAVVVDDIDVLKTT
jgi:hypothetical protein